MLSTHRGSPGGARRGSGVRAGCGSLVLLLSVLGGGLLLAGLSAPAPLLAQGTGSAGGRSDRAPNVITRIEVQGTVNTSEGEILANIASRVGQPLDGPLVTRDIKTLYSLGYFRRVRAEAEEVTDEGYILRFVVREKPRIVGVALRGNTQVSNDDLFEAMTIEVGSFFSTGVLRENADQITSAYRTEGYLKVKVTPSVEPLDDFSYRVNFDVEESPRQYITDIRVKNTTVFTELEIQRFMQSAEVDCFDWVNDSGVFDEDRINQDLQVIVARYLQRGYVRVFIAKPKVTLIHNAEFSRVIVELDISEGAQYFTGVLDVTGDILGDKQRLIDALSLETGEVFNALKQNRDTAGLRQLYQEQGYAFARVRPDVRIDDDRKIVDVTYEIVQGEKAYIGRIEFQGNRETRDFVLRREFEVQENDLYDGRKLRRTQQSLLGLGYFAPSLRLETKPQDVPNVLDVVTKLEETQTGTLQLQVGFSEQSGTTVAASVSKGNFLGRGQTLRTTVRWAQRSITRNISVDFIEPHLFGSEYSSDSSIAFRVVEDETELERGTFEEVFGSQGVGHPLFGPWRINLALSALNRTFEDTDDDPVKLRTFTTSFIYNTVNHPVFPSDGSSITLALSQIGGQVLAGSTEYRRYRMRAQRFIGLNEANSLILMGRLRMGWLEQVGNNVIPPEERFRIGGINTVRGYRFNDIGGPFGRLEQDINAISRVALDEFGQPILDSSGNVVIEEVDKRTLGLDDESLEQLRGGGIFERLVNIELLFPLGTDSLRGVVFYDAGQVNAEKEQYEILSEEEPGFFDLLQSVGAGIRMITPLGVLRFEYGIKLQVEPGESPDEFDFTISTLF